MHEDRRTQFLKLITDAKFKPEQAAFVTAFQSREHGAFKKTADGAINFEVQQPTSCKVLQFTLETAHPLFSNGQSISFAFFSRNDAVASELGKHP
jgi:hypothetical protein